MMPTGMWLDELVICPRKAASSQPNGETHPLEPRSNLPIRLPCGGYMPPVLTGSKRRSADNGRGTIFIGTGSPTNWFAAPLNGRRSLNPLRWSSRKSSDRSAAEPGAGRSKPPELRPHVTRRQIDGRGRRLGVLPQVGRAHPAAVLAQHRHALDAPDPFAQGGHVGLGVGKFLQVGLVRRGREAEHHRFTTRTVHFMDEIFEVD